MARVRLFGLIAFLVAASNWSAGAQTQQPNSQPKTAAPESQLLQLSPEAAQVADEIGVAQLFDQLRNQRYAGSRVRLESLAVRQEITEKVFAASLDVDSLNAVIDSEIEQIRSIRSDLQSKRDKAQNIVNITSIVTGGAFGAIASALQFKPG